MPGLMYHSKKVCQHGHTHHECRCLGSKHIINIDCPGEDTWKEPGDDESTAK